MNTVLPESNGFNFTSEEPEAGALVRVALNNRLTDDLSQQLTDGCQTCNELIRHEIDRLCTHNFWITCALNNRDPVKAYKLACLENLDGLELTA